MLGRGELLDKAKELIIGDRDQEYGNAFTNFDDIAKGWSVIFREEVTREQVALCMAWVKMARLVKNPEHEDSWIDIAGYSALGGELSSMDVGMKLAYSRQSVKDA
tara:strand:+ start:249 stop:563 length:315 start_codon:yes stop_codon:yes gene_type:complete